MSNVKETAGLIGQSEAMARVRVGIERAARHASSVLITGETGTGKELIAKAIHAGSGRRGRFVAVNCAAIAETLAESELFGHVRGAFTGASEGRAGMIRAADGGTVFLDEIGEASGAMQAKLLRAIQEKTVTPVGTERGVTVDVRFIAATNRDLRAEMASGRFRADLYYRLAGAEIWAPPLRERGEDIGELAEHFLARAGSGRVWTRGGLGALTGYGWPGNVRELEHVVERVRLERETGAITAAEVYAVIGNVRCGARRTEARPRLERETVRRVMEETGNNVSATARALGTTRNTVRKYLQPL
jgi:two-component system response regulator HydG